MLSDQEVKNENARAVSNWLKSESPTTYTCTKTVSISTFSLEFISRFQPALPIILNIIYAFSSAQLQLTTTTVSLISLCGRLKHIFLGQPRENT